MNKLTDESFRAAYKDVSQFRNPITDDIARKTYASFKHPGNKYLDKVNNWIILGAGAIFSVMFSNVANAYQFMSAYSIRLIIILVAVCIAMSLLSKLLLSIHIIYGEGTIHFSNLIHLRLRNIDHNRQMIVDTVKETPVNLKDILDRFKQNFVNDIMKTKIFIDSIRKELDRQSKRVEINSAITKFVHCAVQVIMFIQALLFLIVFMVFIYEFFPRQVSAGYYI